MLTVSSFAELIRDRRGKVVKVLSGVVTSKDSLKQSLQTNRNNFIKFINNLAYPRLNNNALEVVTTRAERDD
jgi:hypothetical protein